jgi:hypothetical protein
VAGPVVDENPRVVTVPERGTRRERRRRPDGIVGQVVAHERTQLEPEQMAAAGGRLVGCCVGHADDGIGVSSDQSTK